jgi:ABC-type polysaccharide/polyol phosphate transport system ATPase subunit
MSLVQIENVNLIFKVFRERRIKDILIPESKFYNYFRSDGTVHAIKELNLSINDGARVAVIGRNGAGKSTLLKLISGIYPPTTGRVNVEGKISSMFELSTGFEMEQSGWDNIYLRGLMLGESPESIKEKMPEIAEVSELGEFLYMPVKYYSSGMFVLLAFKVSTAIHPDILLLDEIVASGDIGFLEKAKERMSNMVESANIMVLVTHGMIDAVTMCNRCIWLDHGSIIMDDDPLTVTKAYTQSAHEQKYD